MIEIPTRELRDCPTIKRINKRLDEIEKKLKIEGRLSERLFNIEGITQKNRELCLLVYEDVLKRISASRREFEWMSNQSGILRRIECEIETLIRYHRSRLPKNEGMVEIEEMEKFLKCRKSNFKGASDDS